MSDRIRAGIVGTGFMGTVHARAVRRSGGVVSRVVGSTPASTAAAAERFDPAYATAGVEELIEADDVDVVHVCTPNATHAAIAAAALGAGKHVVCEKPLATSLAVADDLTTAASGRVATVPFVYRFYPTVRAARARVADGTTGPVRLLHGHYLQDWMARPDDENWRVDPELGGGSRAFADIGVALVRSRRVRHRRPHRAALRPHRDRRAGPGRSSGAHRGRRHGALRDRGRRRGQPRRQPGRPGRKNRLVVLSTARPAAPGLRPGAARDRSGSAAGDGNRELRTRRSRSGGRLLAGPARAPPGLPGLLRRLRRRHLRRHPRRRRPTGSPPSPTAAAPRRSPRPCSRRPPTEPGSEVAR